MILLKLKFYNWLVTFFNQFSHPSDVSYNLLTVKDINNLFSFTIYAEINERLPKENSWTPIRCYFRNYPDYSMSPKEISVLLCPFDLDYIIKNKISDTKIIYDSLAKIFGFWYWFPECISALKKYYPVMNIPFDELEYRFIDFWIEVLPIFEDCLGHLLIQDTPFVEPRHTVESLYIPAPYLIMQPPLKKDIDFSQHLEAYYFGKRSDPVFLEVVTTYLENRPLLKNKCTIAWEHDKASNVKVSSNLAIYFICNYLIKNVSKYTLRFVAANTLVAEIRPIKKLQEECSARYNSLSPESRAFRLKNKRDFLEEKRIERALGINLFEKIKLDT